MATIIPLLAIASGCKIIEKHICLSRKSSEYDFYSALEPDQMKLLVKKLEKSVISTYFLHMD